jgi:hypothetical protein
MPGRSGRRREKDGTSSKRAKRLTVLFFVVLLLGVGTGVGMNLLFAEPSARREKESAKEEFPQGDSSVVTREEEVKAVAEFKVSQAMSHIFSLAEQIGERPAGSVRASGAADYVVRKLGEFGYTVEEQAFTTPEGYGSRNIIGTSRGKRDGYTILVGAHYDSAQSLKGATNDASGVGVLLELARIFEGHALEPTVKFVFFGANMPSGRSVSDRLIGSRRFVEMLGSLEKKEIVGMISLDCVSGGEQLAFRTQETGLQRLKAKMVTFARESGLEPATLKSTEDSDNIPFEDAGMPAVWVEWREQGGDLQTDETYESVDPGKVGATGDLLRSFLVDLTSDDLEELKY